MLEKFYFLIIAELQNFSFITSKNAIIREYMSEFCWDYLLEKLLSNYIIKNNCIIISIEKMLYKDMLET